MAYKCGDLQLAPNCDEDAEGVYISEEVRGKYYLPHSCDEWVIGTKEDLLNLKADIEAMLKE